MDQECQSCWCTKVDREQSLIYKVPVKVLNILTDKGSTRCKSLVKSSIELAASRTPNLLFILFLFYVIKFTCALGFYATHTSLLEYIQLQKK